MPRKVHAPRGTELTCKNWQIEAVYRMIQNNLDPVVAFDPDNLIVYGGRGKAARNWEAFEAIVIETRARGIAPHYERCRYTRCRDNETKASLSKHRSH